MSLEKAVNHLQRYGFSERVMEFNKYKAMFSVNKKMLPVSQVKSMIGHSIGGVCPFGVHECVGVYLDISLKRFDTAFPACGSSNSAIELTIPELELLCGYPQWVDVCKYMN